MSLRPIALESTRRDGGVPFRREAHTVIELYDTCGTFLGSDDDSGGGYSSLLSYTATGYTAFDLEIRKFSDAYDEGKAYTVRVTDSTVIFYDGFESSGANLWSAMVP